MRWLLLFSLSLLSASAYADPVSAAVALVTIIDVGWKLKLAVMAFAFVYGSSKARSARRKAEAQAKAAYNSSLSERNVTALRAAPPRRYVYGRCWTGGDIVGIFTTDKQGTDDQGDAYTKPDAYKHLVVVFAGHQSQAMHDITLDGKSIGLSTLDANGWSTNSEFSKIRKTHREFTLAAGASKTLPYSMTVNSALKTTNLGDFGLPNSSSLYTLSNSNKTITNDDSEPVRYSVVMDERLSSVRVAYKLGSSTQLADTYLTTLLPSKWTSNHRLRGLTYAIITLDLEDKRFQSSPPQILAEISGKLCYDPRTSTTAWSENVAVCLRDYIKNIVGVPDSMIEDAAFIAAANACDVGVQNKKYINGVLNQVTKSKFTFNGVVTSDDSREAMLDEFADAMAGFVTQSAKWTCGAGAWAAPVMTLNDDDLDGQIEIVQGDVPMSDLFNGVRGQYIPSNTATPIDYKPYKNDVMVAADGKNLWKDKSLPFTNDAFIATAIARILTETSRNGQVIRYPAKLKAIGLQIGDRVTVNSTEYGFASKTYRVTDKQFSIDAPVLLTLQEDAAAAYDMIDSTVADPTPNTGLPNPFDVASLPDVSGLSVVSDQTTLRRQSDGTTLPRIKVSWTKYSGPYVTDGSGYMWVRWRRVARDASGAWRSQRLPGDSVSTFIEGVTDGDVVIVGVWAQNSFGGTSDVSYATATVAGRTASAAAVTGLTAVAAPGTINLSWTQSTDPDYADTEVRVGASWDAGSRVFKGKASAFVYPQAAPASATFYVKHFTTWGGESASAATVTATSLSLNSTLNYDFTNGADGWSGIEAVVDDATASGGKYGRQDNSGQATSPRYVPIDPTRTYRVTARVRAGVGAVTLYVGARCFDSTGASITNSGGGTTHPLCAADGVVLPFDGNWYTYTGVIGGETQSSANATTNPSKFFSGTAFAAPLAYASLGAGESLHIDYLVFEDITNAVTEDISGPNLIKNPEILGAASGATSVPGWTRAISGTALQADVFKATNNPSYGPPWNKNAPVLQSQVDAASEAVRWYTTDSIPIDPDADYFLSAWIKQFDATEVRIYLGVICYDSTGTNIGNVYIKNFFNPSQQWTKYSGIVGPSGVPFIAGTVAVRVQFYGAYNTSLTTYSGQSMATRFSFSLGRTPSNSYLPEDVVDTPNLVNGATYGSATEVTTVSRPETSTFTGTVTIDCTDTNYTTDGTTTLLVLADVMVSFSHRSGALPDHVLFQITPRAGGVNQETVGAGPLVLRDVGHSPDWQSAVATLSYSYIVTPTAGAKAYDASVLIIARDGGGVDLTSATGAAISVKHSIVIVELKR